MQILPLCRYSCLCVGVVLGVALCVGVALCAGIVLPTTTCVVGGGVSCP